MVFFFIAYLSIIFLFCFPFNIKIVVFFSNLPKISLFCANIGFIRISPKKIKKKKSGKKKKIPIKIGVKQISVKKPIDFNLSVYAVRPRGLRYAERAILGVPLDTVGRFLNAKLPSVSVCVADSEGGRLSASVTLKVRFNLFLIISSVVQTIKIRRK